MKHIQKTKMKSGLFKAASWKNPDTFIMGNSIGWFYIFDTRTSFKSNFQNNKKFSGLKKISVSSLNPENHLLAFGGNESIVKIFDLRNTNKNYHSVSTKFSKFYIRFLKAKWYLEFCFR